MFPHFKCRLSWVNNGIQEWVEWRNASGSCSSRSWSCPKAGCLSVVTEEKHLANCKMIFPRHRGYWPSGMGTHFPLAERTTFAAWSRRAGERYSWQRVRKWGDALYISFQRKKVNPLLNLAIVALFLLFFFFLLPSSALLQIVESTSPEHCLGWLDRQVVDSLHMHTLMLWCEGGLFQGLPLSLSLLWSCELLTWALSRSKIIAR